MKDYTYEEQIIIADNMLKFGGSFIKSLSTAYLHADIYNKRKLVTAFSEEFEKYLNF